MVRHAETARSANGTSTQIQHHLRKTNQNLERFATALRLHRSFGMNPHAEALKKRTFDFALQIVYFCRRLRKTWEGDEFADQIFRAGTRVGANYRAACRGRSHDDFVAKLGHVVEEADESVYWLELIAAAKTVNDPTLPTLIAEANELSAIFNQSQLTARTNQAARNAAHKSKSPNRQSNP